LTYKERLVQFVSSWD